MSFVVKAVKKVFKKIKKVAKRLWDNKWFRVAAIAALTVFTAGVGSAGFAAFKGVSTIGEFFGAVGQTMSTGWGAISNGIGKMFGAGTEATTAAPTAAEAMTEAEVLTEVSSTAAPLADGVSSGTMSTMSDAAIGAAQKELGANALVNVVADEGSKNLLSKVGSLLMDKGVAGTMARQGIMMGIQGYYDEKDRERQEFYYRNRTIWGGPAFGGSKERMEFLMPGTKAYKEKQAEMFSTAPAIERGAQAAQNQQMTPQSYAEAVTGQPGVPQQGTPQSQAIQQSLLMPNQQPQQTQAPPPAPNPRQARVNPNALFTPQNLGMQNG